MNTVRKKQLIYTCFLTFFIIMIGFPSVIFAGPTNVSDCYEEGDCLEIEAESTTNEDEQLDDPVVSKGSSLLLNIVKMVFALLLILTLIYVMVRLFNKKNRLISQTNALENIGGISLGPNKSIQVVRVGTRVYMIGVGENVELLQEIEDEEVIYDLIHSTEIGKSGTMPWLESLVNWKDKDKKDNTNRSFNKLFNTELTKLKENRSALIRKHQKKDDEHE